MPSHVGDLIVYKKRIVQLLLKLFINISLNHGFQIKKLKFNFVNEYFKGFSIQIIVILELKK